MWIALLATGLLVLLAGYWTWSRGKDGEDGSLHRKLSFMSTAVYLNMFPSETAVDSIINAALLLKPAPPSKEVYVEGLMQLFERDPSLYRLWSTVTTSIWGLQFEETTDRRGEITKVVYEHTVTSDEALHQYIELEMDKKIEMDGILHRSHLIRNTGGDSVILVRFHHSIGDGYGLLYALTQLLTDMDGKPLDLQRQSASKRQIRFSFGALLRCLWKLGKLPLMRDSATSLTRIPSNMKPLQKIGKKVYTVSPSLSVKYLRNLKEALPGGDFTINDVISTAFGVALQRYVLEEDGQSEDQSELLRLRVMVPVALPRRGEKLRNRWCFISVSLLGEIPLNARLDRLRVMHKQMAEIKSSAEPLVQLSFQSVADKFTPLAIKRAAISSQFAAHSAIFSNVVGPSEPVKICQVPVSNLFVPFPNVRPQVIVTSYANRLSMTLTVDDQVVKKPSRIVELFIDEILALSREAGNNDAEKLILED